MELLDYQSKPIGNGTTVAFNYSGSVRLGFVKEIKEVTRHGHKAHEIHITHMYGRHVSVVDNVDSLCVIQT